MDTRGKWPFDTCAAQSLTWHVVIMVATLEDKSQGTLKARSSERRSEAGHGEHESYHGEPMSNIRRIAMLEKTARCLEGKTMVSCCRLV